MNKLYDRIDWNNNTTPALNETNLNLMSKAVDDIDDRVIEIADDVLVVVPEILDKYADIEALATNPPYIGQNGDWWTWDTDTNQYVDSGVDAGVSVSVGTTTTLPAGSSATVTNSGTDTDPILNFGIPQGAAGQNGADGQDGTDGQDGVSPEVTIATITGGHTVTITDVDHPTGQSFNVMDGVDGQDGQDGQDGAPGVGVPTGGTTGQVLKKASGTDYDTEWANESGGGSGGHTIINSAGTNMTQRTGLQFVGADVTDDSTNDKTIVTTIPQSMIGDAWASGQAYVVGDYRIDGNVLYKCKTDHTSSASNRPPYASYWDAVSVGSELSKKWTLLGSLTSTSGDLTLPSDYKEIYITLSQIGHHAIVCQYYVPKEEMDNMSTFDTYSGISFLLTGMNVHSGYTNKYFVDSCNLNFTKSTRKFNVGYAFTIDANTGAVSALSNYAVRIYYR